MGRSVFIGGRLRSEVTLTGYRLGMKPPNAGKRYPAEVLSRDEVDRLLAAMGRGYAGVRNRALTVVLWRCGLRISEALALYPKDVDLRARTLTVLHGKGDRRRVVGLDQQTCVELERWLERRRELGLTFRNPLFCVISRPTVGKAMYSSCVREALKEAGVRAGIDKRVHPHGLRHTYACELLREGKSLLVIQALLGHADPTTTFRYLSHLEPREAIVAAQQREWAPLTHVDRPAIAA